MVTKDLSSRTGLPSRGRMKKGEAVLELVEFTDPYCTWCWGSEPVLRRIGEVFGDQVRIGFRMGGLVEDIGRFYDPYNEIGGAGWYEQVVLHWRDASSRHGMPVDERIFYDIKDELRSTYPANIACKAAELQDAPMAKRFLRRMREAAAAERRAIHRIRVQADIAAEVGLDGRRFLADIRSGRAEKAFLKDLQECRLRGISGFPTFIISGGGGEERVLQGYHGFAAFERAFRELAGDRLKARRPVADNGAISAFVRKYGSAAPREVAEVFGLAPDAADRRLRDMARSGLLVGRRAGNGLLFSPARRGASRRRPPPPQEQASPPRGPPRARL